MKDAATGGRRLPWHARHHPPVAPHDVGGASVPPRLAMLTWPRVAPSHRAWWPVVGCARQVAGTQRCQRLCTYAPRPTTRPCCAYPPSELLAWAACDAGVKAETRDSVTTVSKEEAMPLADEEAPAPAGIK